MTAQELLRALVDLIDKNSQSDQPVNTNNAELTPVEVDHTDQTTASRMVPPLQQKMELLKKAAGVDSIYNDNDAATSDSADCGSSDELDILKKNAGINKLAVVAHEAGEDNDVLG